MKRVLITGIGGFIGSHLLDHVLANTDWEVVGIDSFRHKGRAERITDSVYWQQHRDRVQIILHNLVAPISPVRVQQIGHIDYIVNMASESHVDRAIADPVPFVENNVALVLNVLEYARVARPEAFIQISTDEVYGPARPGYAHHEWDAIVPSNPYAASKAAQEAIAISYWRTYAVPIVLTQTMNNYGERQDPEKFIPKVIRSVLRGETVPIHGDPQTGETGSRFYLHARNHADAIVTLLRHNPPAMYPSASRPDRFNIVGEREIENLELAQLIARAMGKPLLYEIVDFHAGRPGHDRRYALDGHKMAAQMGWNPPVDLMGSLAKTINWYEAHPEWLESHSE